MKNILYGIVIGSILAIGGKKYFDLKENQTRNEIIKIFNSDMMVINTNLNERLNLYPKELLYTTVSKMLLGKEYPYFVKVNAMEYIIKNNLSNFVPDLIEVLKDTNVDLVAYFAVVGIDKLGGKEYSDILNNLLASWCEKNNKKLIYLFRIIPDFKNETTFENVKKVLVNNKRDLNIRVSAGIAMQKVNEDFLINYILDMLRKEKLEKKDVSFVKKVIENLNVSNSASLLCNEFMLKRAYDVDSVFLYATSRLFNEESIRLLCILYEKNICKKNIKDFFKQNFGIDFKDVKELKEKLFKLNIEEILKNSESDKV